jgi:hypothetical protein
MVKVAALALAAKAARRRRTEDMQVVDAIDSERATIRAIYEAWVELENFFGRIGVHCM